MTANSITQAQPAPAREPEGFFKGRGARVRFKVVSMCVALFGVRRQRAQPGDAAFTRGGDSQIAQSGVAASLCHRTPKSGRPLMSGTPPWGAHLARVLIVVGAVACVAFPVTPAGGLLAGACIALLLGNPVAKLTHKWSGLILQAAVVLLGAEMNLGIVWRVGAGGVGYTLAGIALAMTAGLWLGRRFGLDRDVALLVSAGTAICGGSAIAAVSAATKPRAHDVAVSLGSVFLLTSLGMLVFPLLGHGLGFSEEQFGMWSALALHDTSSVVGAATGYGATALGIAVTVKLARALWIVPVTAVMSWWRDKKAEESPRLRQGAQAAPAAGAWRRFVPQPFIVLFLVVVAAFTYVPVWAPALGGVFEAAAPWCGLGAHRFLTLALFLVGAGLSREALRKTGVRPLKMAFALWVFVSVATALALWAGWIVAPQM